MIQFSLLMDDKSLGTCAPLEDNAMVSIQEYLQDPCGTLSIPYWKAKSISLPEDMRIVHRRDFMETLLTEYIDEPYFRLKHDLTQLPPAALPEQFTLCAASDGEYAVHINGCYADIRVSPEEVGSWRDRGVFCPDLWLAVRDARTSAIAATGIGELDRETGEGVLEWIQVSPDFRGRGLGRCVVVELLRRMKGNAAFATVSGRCSNPTNPEILYRRCGFSGTDIWHILRKK